MTDERDRKTPRAAPEPIEPEGAKGKNHPSKSPPPAFEFDPARTGAPAEGGPPGS